LSFCPLGTTERCGVSGILSSWYYIKLWCLRHFVHLVLQKGVVSQEFCPLGTT
jgi:hypothetical protein